MPKEKKITVHFPDDFKFPKYHQEKNITKTYNGLKLWKESSCDSCPFDYERTDCILAEDGTEERYKCPFYDSEEVEFDAKEPV